MRVYPARRIKLIYNPNSGRTGASPALLQEVLAGLQALNFIPEVHLLLDEPGLDNVVDEALRRKIRLFVVCGGDGTIEMVARRLAGSHAVLGIVPAGTQNNVALSLGIPQETSAALALLRNQPPQRIDLGFAANADASLPFLEICSVGLLSALFEQADQLQKGDLGSIGGLLSTLASFPSAQLMLRLDDGDLVQLEGHVALIANLPYFGLNYQVAPATRPDDGVLDVLVFNKVSKIELVGNILQTAGEATDDPRLRRYRARKIELSTQPPLPVLADGSSFGNTPLTITVQRRALSVITGLPTIQPSGPRRWGFLRNLDVLGFFRKKTL